MGDYFQRISNGTIGNQMLSSYYAGQVLEGLDLQLQKGRVEISDEP
jgi:hypothetical protein